MDAVCVDLSNAKGRAGMHCTALSRVRTAEGLYFQKSASNLVKTSTKQLTAFAGKHITTSKEVVAEMERMRRDCQLELHPTPLTTCDDAILTITMINVSTLRPNNRHIASCPNVKASDVVVLQETRTIGGEAHSLCFPGYEVIERILAQNLTSTGRDTVPFNGSIMLCKEALRPLLSYLTLHAMPPNGIEIIQAKLPSCHVISIYKRPSVHIGVLINYLREMMGTESLTDSPPMVLIGDFNIDLMATCRHSAVSSFVSFMEAQGLNQLIDNPTTINGSLIDHIWTNIDHSEARQFVAPHSDHSYIAFRMTSQEFDLLLYLLFFHFKL